MNDARTNEMGIAPPTLSRPPRLISVGTKLAGSTVALILVVTIAIFGGISRYQRESLLESKELAATAVSRLFADSCVAPVVFNDEAAINDALATLGHNTEVDGAALWSVDAAGAVGPLIAKLPRGTPEVPPATATTAARVQRHADRVVVTSPVRNGTGKVLAESVIGFSLDRENAAIAAVERRTLAVSAGVAIGLTMMLLAIARFAIVRPLGKLVVAAGQLERGVATDIDIRSNDEIGQLAAAFRTMATAIRSREDRIRARNEDMGLVLDNVGQGFITLDIEGNMSQERSRVVEEWFGHTNGAAKLWDYLHQTDPKVAQWFELGWASVREDVMPLELCLAQLPHTLRKQGKTFELAYRPVMNGEVMNKTIVVITDVTARIEREGSEQTQREMMSLFHRILSDRAAFEGFFAEASSLVDAIEHSDGSDLQLLKRQVHTLKGNCALFGVEGVANYCHEIENRLDESPDLFGASERAALRALWSRVSQMRAQFSQGGVGRIELERDEYDAFLDDLRRRVDHHALAATFSSWKFEPVTRRLALFAEQIQHLGARLGKAEIDVRSQRTKLRLPPRKWGPFWSAFAHVIRNSIDHGIETTDERRAAGKPLRGLVELGIAHEGPNVVVTIQDDGRGIDWEAIRSRARELGLPHTSPEDLNEALFSPGVSSRVELSTTSGRGVGLGAVREMVRQLGGQISIASVVGRGATFRFLLPQTMLFEDGPTPDVGHSDARVAFS